MDLLTRAQFRQAFLRLTGSRDDDAELIDRGEEPREVIYMALTRGTRAAQRRMLRFGYQGWIRRAGPLSWTPTDDDEPGGFWSALPADCLRVHGNASHDGSALFQSNGRRWGQEVVAWDEGLHGNYYFVPTLERIYLTRGARPPGDLRVKYHYKHPAWDDTTEPGDIDFPDEARPLIVAEAAAIASDENWIPGGQDMEKKIARALMRASEEARDVARTTKQARTMRRSPRLGNRY